VRLRLSVNLFHVARDHIYLAVHRLEIVQNVQDGRVVHRAVHIFVEHLHNLHELEQRRLQIQIGVLVEKVDNTLVLDVDLHCQ
tara:strand:+ start:258 stop:506 length:249 start_codon:yes stop_codon:yes gene_type:complete